MRYENWILFAGAKKIKNSACIEKAGVVSYELQGRLGLRRVALVPRSAKRKTDA